LADVVLAVLVSGSGTILEAMIERGLVIDRVVADRPCRALDVAASAGVVAHLLDRASFGGFTKQFDRAGYSLALADVLDGVDLVAMAGFGTITTAEFHERFAGRVLNTHPSLLPAFKGWHAVRDALAAGVSETGCTVHVATVELDDGPVLAQERVQVRADDDEATLHERIKDVERDLYPRVVAEVVDAMGRGEDPTSIAAG
jgi:phosphoribosylglycinamide formyltransferase-1